MTTIKIEDSDRDYLMRLKEKKELKSMTVLIKRIIAMMKRLKLEDEIQ